MRGAILYGPRDVRFEERADPRIIDPTDAVIRMSTTRVCGSDLWPYRGINANVMEILHYGEESVSVAMEEVASRDWAEKVYKADIQNHRDKLYKKPGYDVNDL
jgi:threonine dehydrogenase-like Zn-dependent dehydrogenase